jgi:hypothetical protein
MTPVTTTEFHKLKKRGIISEMAVQETAIWNMTQYMNLRGHQDCDRILLTRDIRQNAPYDILGYAVTGLFHRGFTIEVKSAKNGGRYRTFFAELVQIGSLSYSEYLLHPPTYMVYVDIETDIHFWYDGQIFVDAVKAHWADRVYNWRGTAAGVRFDITSDEFGFMWAVNQSRSSMDIFSTRQDEIQMMMQVDKPTPSHKKCDGLPDLTSLDVV